MLCQINSITHINHDVTLKRPIQMRNLTPSAFFLFLFFALACEEIFIKMHNTKIYMLHERNIYRLQTGPTFFQPGNCRGCGSEGVNTWHKYKPLSLIHI